ncbi:hypothetical protein [Sphingomonas sp. MMS24-J13]|uniref:hypothetical protein n=1 Tax=Sphingomonas sp. MMS24-J13 TaxID=3238686 RepID=UPI00384EACDD
MRSKTFEVPGVLALLLLLATNYGLGYGLGINLTGSVIGAILLAFIVPCLTMIGVVLIAASGTAGNQAQ